MGGILVIFVGLFAVVAFFVLAAFILFATMYGLFDEERKHASQVKH